MSKRIASVIHALWIGVCLSRASAAVVADFQADFRYPVPGPGWQYLWNADGPIGNSGNYVPLKPNVDFEGVYDTLGSGALPHDGPGAALAVTSTAVYPGQGSAQAADGIGRYVIVAYTVSAADIAASGSQAWLATYHFVVPPDSLDGVGARIYINDRLVPLAGEESILPPGLDYDNSSPGAYPVPLGNLRAGDTIYIAVGPRGTDTSDRLGLDFKISLIPEPSVSLLFAALGAFLAARRR